MRLYISFFFLFSAFYTQASDRVKCDYSEAVNSCSEGQYCVFIDDKKQAFCQDSYKGKLPTLNFPFKNAVSCYKAVDHDHKQSSHSWLNARYAVDLHSDEHSTQNVFASVSGLVVAKGGCLPVDPKCNGWFGNQVKILAPSGILVFYAHLSRLFVKTGDYVKVGDLIGREGDTGAVGGMWTKPHDFHHLHISVHSDWTKFSDSFHRENPWPGMPSIPFNLNICNPEVDGKCELVATHIKDLKCSKFTKNPKKIRGL